MTDLNKPVEITHDPVTGDIASIHQYPYSTSEPMTVDEVRANAFAASRNDLEDPSDWWAEQEKFGDADLPDDFFIKKPKSFIEKETSAIMKRVTTQITPATAHFKKLDEAAQKATTEFKKLGAKVEKFGKDVKKNYHEDPSAPLTHRPFHTRELARLRDALSKR